MRSERAICQRALGGDEFALLLPETGSEGAQNQLLERFRSTLARKFYCQSPCPVSASIGAVSFTSSPLDLGDLVQEADARMYAAKLAGKEDRIVHEVIEPSTNPDLQWKRKSICRANS